MSAPHIILDILPSLCEKLSDLVAVWRNIAKIILLVFFETLTRCIFVGLKCDCLGEILKSSKTWLQIGICLMVCLASVYCWMYSCLACRSIEWIGRSSYMGCKGNTAIHRLLLASWWSGRCRFYCQVNYTSVLTYLHYLRLMMKCTHVHTSELRKSSK